MHPQDSDLDAPGPFRLDDNVFYLFLQKQKRK